MAHPYKVGLFLGTLFGGLHLVWSLLVFLGYAQALVDFILWAHMVHVSEIIGPFDATAAATLVVVTAIVGFVVGNVAAHIWNRVHQ